MKYIKAIALTLIIAIIFSGCSFRMSSSIEDLIGPVSPFGDNADIQEALDTYAKNGFSLKTPSGGEYIASYNFYDIDGDGNDEALAFYEPTDDLNTISMALIKKVKDKWSVVDNIKGDGKDIYSISFNDVNADDKVELLVCWDVISNSSNHNLSVYSFENKKDKLSLKQIGEPIEINNYIVVDYNQNSTNELLLFELNGPYASARAELYSLRDNKFDLLGETKLDSHVSAYTNLQVEKAENDVRIYADALSTDGSSMLTEIIYWSDTYGTIVSPFYSYTTGLTKGTSRNIRLECSDINDDGLIEIPSSHKGIKGLPKNVKAVDWNIYKNTILVHSKYALVVSDDDYMVVIPDEIIGEIAVTYDNEAKELTVLDSKTKNKAFAVRPVLKAIYNENDYSNYSVVLEASGYYYLADIGKDSNIKITIDDLKNLVKSIN